MAAENYNRLLDLNVNLEQLVKLPAGHQIVGAYTNPVWPHALTIRIAGPLCPECPSGTQPQSCWPVYVRSNPQMPYKFPLEADREFFAFPDQQKS